MRTLRVQVETPYEIHIGRGLLDFLGAEVKAVLPKAEKLLIVSDNTVFNLYGQSVTASFIGQGYAIHTFVVPQGESSKSLQNFGKGLELMAMAGFKRGDAVIALGGGVVGDLSGFIASAYMRGIAVVQVPTTLLAMVDSSVGGKTAVNLQVGKNMAGAFHEPALVVADTAILDTQTADNKACGLGELLKYAFLGGGRIKELLSLGMTNDNADEIIYLADKYKAEIVAADEKECGLRKLLNLGHTFGHAYERLSDFAIPHGKCVAMGLFDAINVSEKLGMLQAETAIEMRALLTSNGFSGASGFDENAVMDAIESDKKVGAGGVVDFVLLCGYGAPKIQAIALRELRKLNYER